MRFRRILLFAALLALIGAPAALALRFTDDSYFVPIGYTGVPYSHTFEIEKGLFFNRDYGIAFEEIARIEGRDVVLSLSADALAAMRAPGEVGTALADRAAGVVDHARAALDEAVHAGHPSTSKPH